MMDMKFWSLAEMTIVNDVEVKPFKDKGIIEAYDIRLLDGYNLIAELDVTPKIAEMLYDKLKEVLKK